jgi:hypothetical protein
VFDPQTAELLGPGSALIVGTVAADGTPHASRGWGLAIVPDSSLVRLFVAADDPVLRDNLAATGAVAATCGDPRTYRAVQLKGTADVPRPVTDAADLAYCAEYYAAFFAAVNEVEGTPLELLERMVPPGFVVCTMTVTELFNQTPGPGAGAPVTASR